MKESPPNDISEPRSTIGLFFVGGLMIALALLFEPIGSNPDTGLIHLNTVQAKWLLGIMGGLFVLGGIYSARKVLRAR